MDDPAGIVLHYIFFSFHKSKGLKKTLDTEHVRKIQYEHKGKKIKEYN
jgi:hypothetical protein